MVFLQRSNASNPRKRAATGPQPVPRQAPCNPDDPLVDAMTSLLAEAGCTLRVPRGAPPSLSPDDPHRIPRHLEHRFCSDPALVPSFLSGFNSYIQSQSDLHRVLLPISQNNRSLARILLSVPAIQPQIQQMLLEKLPEHFNDTSTQESLSLKDDVARLIINQFRWLDFLVDPTGFAEKLMEVLSVAPSRIKREIVGLLPEILGDQCHCTVLPALEGLLNEDSELVVSVLDALSDLNLDEELQEQAITIAISCLRTIDFEHMPHLLRFLLLSANQTNVRRIILQIRDHLKFTGPTDPSSLLNKKLKGKCAVNSTDAAILDTLRSNLRFKNILCEAILRELKLIDKPQYHKAIDVWFLILIHSIGGTLQRSVEKMLKKKVVRECLQVALFDQCIHSHRELVKDHFASFLSVTEYLLSCKEDKARDFAIHLFMVLFEEFCDIYSRQEILGILVTHIGSGVSLEVCSALDTMVLLTSKHSEELVPISSHINGILDYLEGFCEDNLRKVYDIFCHLALCCKSTKDTGTSSIGNELLMIVRKQVSNPDKKYRKMGIIGTLRVVRALGDAHSSGNFSSQKSNSEEALELLRMAINSCKTDVLPLILLYDELSALLERESLQSTILDWIGIHAGEFESLFLADLEEGQLTSKHISDGIEGELWMNLDGDLSPVCLNILPIVASSLEQNPSSLQVLPSQFTLLSVVERSTNQGSLGGIDALLGCPLHLPSPKCLDGVNWRKLSEKQRKIVFLSFYYAINWIRELLNAFSTQVGMVDFITQKTKNEMAAKLLKRLRNLILLEGLLDRILQSDSLTLPELSYSSGNFHSRGRSKSFNLNPRKRGRKPKSQNNKEKEVSDTPNPEGMYLKQPTIMDAFKKAGVSVSQELPNGSSPRVASSNACSPELEAEEIEIVDLSMVPVQLELQRCNFRPLLGGSFSLLAFSETCSSCCSDPLAELPLYLYLLRDLNIKLEKTQCELLISIRPLFGSFRRLVNNAFAMLRDGYESCPDHWQSTSTSSGNPEIPYVVVSKLPIASFLFKEVLHCYRKMLSFPDIYLQTNLPILREMLESLQPTEDIGLIFSEIQPSRILENLDYLYGGTYIFLETIIDEACSHSYLLASEIIETMQSVVSSVSTLAEKQFGGNEKNINADCSQNILPFLRKRLGESAHKLLSYDLSNCKNGEDTLQNKHGDVIQKILRIYLQNCESTSDLLDHLAASVLPQVPSGKTMDTQEMHHEFQTLSPSMFLTWYRSLHEENHGTLVKMVKEMIPKTRANSNGEAVKGLLEELHKLVNVLVSLVNICRVHDKVAVHAMAVKYGGRFVDTFLKAFGFLKSHFENNSNKIIEMVKGLQKATRLIQTICSEAKGSKRTMITTKIPATKKTLERLLFEVKALLHNNTTGRTFELGMLKHKDLNGQVVSSQVYSNGDDDNDDDNDDHLELDAINEEDGMEVDQDANDYNSNQGDD
ncbi:fanconi anemia group D2 protein [Rhynchospora pubera]|uniref:Fanconi anemia group D2 protein n=1 Tax=Rhynchospora pubera TaxID=906938 RepID=A0AAV8H1K5_9POAL|nr:fanconi anemia group D2 protein [Rhynchospora pubera]